MRCCCSLAPVSPCINACCLHTKLRPLRKLYKSPRWPQSLFLKILHANWIRSQETSSLGILGLLCFFFRRLKCQFFSASRFHHGIAFLGLLRSQAKLKNCGCCFPAATCKSRGVDSMMSKWLRRKKARQHLHRKAIQYTFLESSKKKNFSCSFLHKHGMPFSKYRLCTAFTRIPRFGRRIFAFFARPVTRFHVSRNFLTQFRRWKSLIMYE